MGILKKKIVLTIFMTLLVTSGVGCAKLNYLYEQGMGQMALLSAGKENHEVLKSVRVPKTHKEKIKKIEELKKYFYTYWEKKETKIYSQTTMLKQRAVTYLVIVSPHSEIKAMDTCFPLMGCFPYLGFFNLNSAKDFAKEKEIENNVTWIRPVYAYSTLGYFTDTILSSFFEYDDYELSELIFHELFHTIFFVKNQVDLNENLAMYFSDGMLEDYYISTNQIDYMKFEQKRNEQNKKIKTLVVHLASELQLLYKSLLPQTKEDSNAILNEFLEDRFKVEVMKKCQSLDIQPKDCFPLERKWNNASFAAFLTYEKKSNDLASLQKKLGLDLKGYYNWITKKYDEFLDQTEDSDFEIFLFK